MGFLSDLGAIVSADIDETTAYEYVIRPGGGGQTGFQGNRILISEKNKYLQDLIDAQNATIAALQAEVDSFELTVPKRQTISNVNSTREIAPIVSPTIGNSQTLISKVLYTPVSGTTNITCQTIYNDPGGEIANTLVSQRTVTSTPSGTADDARTGGIVINNVATTFVENTLSRFRFTVSGGGTVNITIFYETL